MDSLTKRLLSTSGLDSSRPLLPPVQNMRMVYLKEPFGDAEIALHEARLALEKVNAGGPPEPLYRAMAKLEVKEQEYFAKRYFGRNKAVLNGWNVEWKQEVLVKKINSLLKQSYEHAEIVGGKRGEKLVVGYHQKSLNAANYCVRAYQKLKQMNERYYNKPDPTSEHLESDLELIRGNIQRIQENLVDTRGLPDSVLKEASLGHIKATVRMAQTCERIAILVKQNRWDLPDDLRV